MKNRRLYSGLHALHGSLLLLLLATGACLWIPELRSFFAEGIRLIHSVHIALGVVYLTVLLLAVFPMAHYLRLDRRWTKTFHVCLQYTLGLGWSASGLYLWANPTNYLGIRQFASLIHDALSLFILPWVLGHIVLWYWRKEKQSKLYVRKARTVSRSPKTALLTRRDVLLLFGGGILSFVAGGLFKWYRPLTEAFAASLEEGKRRGYFRIYSVRSEDPPFDPAAWELAVDGLVERSLRLRFDELTALPIHSVTSDFHCVTGWSVTHVNWRGVPFSEIVDRVKPSAEGIYVKMYSADRIYTETYELSQLLQSNVLLAFELDGKPLLPQQGAPLRLVHPDMYGYKSIKWLERIEFTRQRGLGYWEEKEGYDLNGYIS